MSEHWDFYFTLLEDSAASIYLDLGISEEAPLEEHTDILWLRVAMRHAAENGLSSEEEGDALWELEDQLVNAAESSAVYVGRCTCQGNRDFYFYTDDATVLESKLVDLLETRGDYQYEIGTKEDPEWEAYFEFLFPSEVDFQFIMNRQVVEHLKENGDQHELPRDVNHWIYFQTAMARDAFIAEANTKGYTAANLESDSGEEDRFGAQVTSVSAVDLDTINDLVLNVFELAVENDGEYDGWETSIENGEEAVED